MSFVHLHNHSEYSLLDGLSKTEEMALYAKELGQEAIALTDHGTMFGAIEFYRTCTKHQVKPIIGCEVYVAPESRHTKTEKYHGTNLFHLLLLAKNFQGYKNLCNIVSRSYTEGFYYKPRIDFELLSSLGDDIIVSSACIQGQLPRLLLSDRMEEAEKLARQFKERFGSDYYIEVMNHGIDEEIRVNPRLVSLARKLDIPIIATHDSHYIKKDDAYPHDILLCIQQLKDYDDPARMRFTGDSFYLKSEEEMLQLFPELPEAIHNTALVAAKCNLEFDFKTKHLPKYRNPDKGISSKEERIQYLRHLCEKNLPYRYGDSIREDIRQRLEYELNVIESMDFVDYFLVVQDFIRYAREKDIAVGPGRGSAAGSIVSYLLRITDLDPLQYNLYFERFLNPQRFSMPDIDIDFEDSRREEIIDYVKEMYGEDCVSQIGTFGKLESRAAFRDVARAFKISPAEINQQSKKIPMGQSLESAYQQSESFKKLVDEDETYTRIYQTATRLEHAVRNFSTHACGILITDEPLWNYVPLAIDKNKKRVSMYEKNTVEQLGLLKMDFLGLKNLTIIKDCCSMVESQRDIHVDFDTITLDDPLTYELYKKGQTKGIFQVESPGMQKWLKELKPDSIEDIIAMVALYRPGPMQNIPSFIQNKQNLSQIQYLDPCLEPVLKNTYGICIYQEQVMNIAQVMSGFSMADADKLRKAMGKKIASLMEEQHEKFVLGAKEKGFSEELAETVFSMLEKFAEYGFNRAHAACYGLLSYRTAYLKANYPAEYMCSLMNTFRSDEKKIEGYIEECRCMDIPILPPHINKSEVLFSLEKTSQNPLQKDGELTETGIRFGLSAIKNVGEAALESILDDRKTNGAYIGIKDFKTRNKTNKVTKRTIEFLIKAGAFDFFQKNRSQLLDNLNNVREEGVSLFETPQSADESESSPPQKGSIETNLLFEKEALGFYITTNPMIQFLEAFPKIEYTTLETLESIQTETEVTIFCMLDSVRSPRKKTKNPVRMCMVSDVSGSMELVAFGEAASDIDAVVQGENAGAIMAFLFTVKVVFRNDGFQALIKKVDRCISLSDVYRQLEKPSRLFLSINLDMVNKSKLTALTQLLQKHTGPSDVVLSLSFRGYRIETHPSMSFHVTRSMELTTELQRLLSPENVWWRQC
ncbi:MAG TPA: DNA polymerase III subunit alpha [Caldisericia bacterium]|nr:DNA polymerase III subunit alpha [Caldisericia bacterium]